MSTDHAIELTMRPHADNGYLFEAIWNDGEVFINGVHEGCIDLAPFARRLLEQGYDTRRTLIVRLRGADYLLMHAPLGAVAATPLVNHAHPVEHPTQSIYHQREVV
ncbi:MAG: hypothetical protein ACLP19_28435 [Xanthobacteraceae bacterium]